MAGPEGLVIFVACWFTAAIAFAICWSAMKLGEMCTQPRPPKAKPEKKPDCVPVPPSREQILNRLQMEFEQNLAVIQKSPLTEAERQVGRDRVTQKFISDLERLL